MKRLICLTLLSAIVLFASLDTAKAQVYTQSESTSFRNDSLFTVPVSLSSEYSVEVWANQTSNTITAGFMNDLAQGGFISHDIINPILNRHTGPKGYLGANTGFNVSWNAAPSDDKTWIMCGSFGSEVIVDSRWTSDLFELFWYGNASSTGEVNSLSGTGVRIGAFNRFSLGLLNQETEQRMELSLVQRLGGAEWSLPYGYLYVSENADSLDSYLQTEARFHMNADSTLLPAYGVGLSGNIPIKSDQFPLEFNLRFKDVGLLFEPGGSQVYWFQEGASTTGLPIFGDSLTWESIVTDIANDEFDFEGDTLVQFGESVSRMVLLPAKLTASLKYVHTDQISFNGSISAGGWMPKNLISAGVQFNRTETLDWGVNYRDGGWGDQRFSVWARLKLNENRALYINVEEPLGLLFMQDTGAETTCRGITIRLTKQNG